MDSNWTLFTNKELLGNVMAGGYLEHSNHEMIEFLILREIRSRASRTAISDFWRVDFALFRRLVDKVS